MHYLLFYDVVPDYAARRAPLRDEHLALAWAAAGRGELILGGALSEPLDGAVLLFRGDSPRVAEDFAAADPYVLSGLVTPLARPRMGHRGRRRSRPAGPPGRGLRSASRWT